MELIENPLGDYRFLTGIAPYSSGVAAASGYEIVRSVMRQPVGWRQGFDIIEQVLNRSGRPHQALCSVELRIPAPLPLDGFTDFNRAYREQLVAWDIPVGGHNPVARTNVAPIGGSPSEPSLHAFSITVPAAKAHPTFIVAGAGDVADQGLDPYVVVRPGETSIAAMREKIDAVMSVMEDRLHGLGASWRDVTTINVYTAESDWSGLVPEMVGRIGHNPVHGFRWHFVNPPIEGLAFEMDLQGNRSTTVLA